MDTKQNPLKIELGYKEAGGTLPAMAFAYAIVYFTADGECKTTYRICLEQEGSDFKEMEVYANTDFNEFVMKWANITKNGI